MRKIIALSLLLCGLLNAETVCKRDHANNIVVCSDEKLGELMWQDERVYEIKWKEAKRYCKDLRLAGYKDWRLPTIIELESIAEKPPYTRDGPIFMHANKEWHWTSSTTFDGSKAWRIANDIGYWDHVYNSNYVRCVRKN